MSENTKTHKLRVHINQTNDHLQYLRKQIDEIKQLIAYQKRRITSDEAELSKLQHSFDQTLQHQQSIAIDLKIAESTDD